MRWHVEAADAKTGMETAFTVEALTEVEAERLARYNGLLVSNIRKAGLRPPGAKPPPVVPYAAPAPVEAAPEYPQLVRRARSTRALGLAFTVLGWITLAAGVALFAYLALRAGWSDWKDWRAWLVPAASRAWPAAVGSLAALAVGSALRLLAAIALVLRFAARGAHRQRPASERTAVVAAPSEAATPARAGMSSGASSM